MVHTVSKVTRILELYSVEDPEWGVSEVGRTLGIPKSTAFELMNSLANQRFLQRTGKGRYRLGWRLFEFSQTLLDTAQYRLEAREEMWQLVETWAETSHLAILDEIQVVYVEKLQSPRSRTIKTFGSPRTGMRLPAHCSAVGKVLLAHREWDEIAPLLELQGMPALTPNTITTPEELGDELEYIRGYGYGYENEEVSVGLRCVAAPIYDDWNNAIAAVSLSMPTIEFRGDKNRYAAAVLEAARRISRSTSKAVRTYTEGRRLLQT